MGLGRAGSGMSEDCIPGGTNGAVTGGIEQAAAMTLAVTKQTSARASFKS